jgi:hypothetical protein
MALTFRGIIEYDFGCDGKAAVAAARAAEDIRKYESRYKKIFQFLSSDAKQMLTRLREGFAGLGSSGSSGEQKGAGQQKTQQATKTPVTTKKTEAKTTVTKKTKPGCSLNGLPTLEGIGQKLMEEGREGEEEKEEQREEEQEQEEEEEQQEEEEEEEEQEEDKGDKAAKTMEVVKEGMAKAEVAKDRPQLGVCWYCEWCHANERLQAVESLGSPFSYLYDFTQHGYRFLGAKDGINEDGDCFFNCVVAAHRQLSADGRGRGSGSGGGSRSGGSTSAEVHSVRSLRRIWAATMGLNQLHAYRQMALASSGESWLDPFRGVTGGVSVVSGVAARGKDKGVVRPSRRASLDARAKITILSKSGTQVTTVDELRRYAEREGSMWGMHQCLWADESAIAAVADHLHLTIFLLDMGAALGTSPYRRVPAAAAVEVTPPTDSRRIIVLKLENKAHYVLLAHGRTSCFTREGLPNAVRGLWLSEISARI